MNSKVNNLTISKKMFAEEEQLKSKNITNSRDITIDVQTNENFSKIENENNNYSSKQIKIKYLCLNLKKIGRILILSEDEQGIKYVMGPLFPIIFLINLCVNIFIIKIVYDKIPNIFKMIGTIINFFQIYFFVFTSIKNPGLPLKEYEHLVYEEENKNAKNFRQCKDCKFWINTDEKTIHCRICQICIEGYDHHCGCMNICIGKNNLKSFYISILTSFILILYSILITLAFK